MADPKKKIDLAKKSGPVKILLLDREEGWFIFKEIEIDESILEHQGKVLSKTNPDIFPIFKDQLIIKAREIFGI
jgi:hypothetical protein